MDEEIKNRWITINVNVNVEGNVNVGYPAHYKTFNALKRKLKKQIKSN